MDIHISPSVVRGAVRAPPSKSYTHRAILAAGYGRSTRVEEYLDSADPRATMRAVEAFGGTIEETGGDELAIEGFDGRPAVPADVIDCANSGTTMRLVTATAALADGTTVLTGDESLRSRPQGPLLEALSDLGVRAESTRSNGQAPLVIEGPLSGGTVSIPGDISSQYITALLMAGAITDEGIEIELTTELKSAPYVDITLEVLEAFGVEAAPIGGGAGSGGGADGGKAGDRRADDSKSGDERAEDSAVRSAGAEGFVVEGGQRYEPADGRYEVPGDFSSISYLLAAGAVASEPGEAVTVSGAQPSAQGDSAIVGILEAMGGDVEWDREAGEIVVRRSDLHGTTVEVADTPDLLPTIAALGAHADGKTVIENCGHVRLKETDRVEAMATELERLGANVTETEETLTVHGDRSSLEGGTVDGYRDHRIIMALSIAALAASGETTIAGADHVDVSFPEFFDVLAGLGAELRRSTV